MISRDNRVLGLYEKTQNKWFVTREKKAWRLTMKAMDKKLYNMSIRMMEGGVLEDYDDIQLDNESYNKRDICKIVDGNELGSVKGTYQPTNMQMATC